MILWWFEDGGGGTAIPRHVNFIILRPIFKLLAYFPLLNLCYFDSNLIKISWYLPILYFHGLYYDINAHINFVSFSGKFEHSYEIFKNPWKKNLFWQIKKSWNF